MLNPLGALNGSCAKPMMPTWLWVYPQLLLIGPFLLAASYPWVWLNGWYTPCNAGDESGLELGTSTFPIAEVLAVGVKNRDDIVASRDCGGRPPYCGVTEPLGAVDVDGALLGSGLPVRLNLRVSSACRFK